MKRWAAKLLTLSVFILIAGSLAFAGTAHAETIGKISAAEGKVDLLKAGQSTAMAVKGGEDISVGDILRTKSASKAEILFSDNSTVRLAQNTRLEVKDFQVDDKGKRVSALLDVERGKIRADISKGANDSFVITTPNAKSLIRGTDIIVLYQKSATNVSVIEGKVSVSGTAEPDKPLVLTSGNATTVLPDQSPSAPRALMVMERKVHEADTDIKSTYLALRKETDKHAVAEGYSRPEGTKAVIINLSGRVEVKNRGAVTWHDAKKDEVLTAGDSVQTKDNGKVEIRLDNNNIINLKAGTVFVIEKLTYDEKTGEYENLFECGKGQIRAKVEKLKGNSKFEVKTPTAVASVRGTILFLNVLANLTNAYFEEGNGILKSVISGIIQDVAAGSSSSADGNGNVSPPIPLTDEQRSHWNEGWEIGGGAEGYSGPEGYSGGYGGGTGDGPNTNWNQNPFSDKPITDTIGTGGGGGGTGGGGGGTGGGGGGEGETTYQLTGTAEGVFGLYGVGGFEATLTSTGSTVPWSGSFPTSLSGTYTNPGESVWWGDVAGEGEAGGVYEGWLGGSWHSWDGVFASIYIDETGRAGQLLGLLSGTNTGESGELGEFGSFTGEGSLIAAQMAQLGTGVEYSYEDVYGYGDLWLSFDNGNGWFDSEFLREKKWIEGQNWGIWRELHDARYHNGGDVGNWRGVAGGYRYDGSENFKGYFFTTIEGADDLQGAIAIGVVGTYLDYDVLGGYYGELLGADIGDGYYQVYGAGGFVEQPLSSSGELYGYSCYYDSWNGYDMDGLVGTVGTLWNGGPFEFVSIGDFYPDEYYEGDYYGYEPFTWYNYYNSYNPDNERYTTYDGGAFYGVAVGDGQYGELLGLARLLYIAPDHSAGVISGDLKGAYSYNIWMYLLDGTLTARQLASAEDVGVDPEDLTDNIYSTGGYGYLKGTISTGGSVEGTDYLETMSIVNYERGIAQPWGIYYQTIIGSFENDHPEYETAWSGKMGGDDAFGAYYWPGEGEGYFNYDYGYWIADVTNGTWDEITDNITDVDAELHGKFITYTKMGTLDGKILGIYEGEDEGEWQGVGAGVWEGEPLTLSGVWGGDSLYYNGVGENGAGYISPAGVEYGLIGATVSPWEGGVEFLAMGEYYYDEGISESDLKILNSPIVSYNGINNTTVDGGAFYGFTAGSWNNEAVNGSAVAIYIDPSGTTAGLLDGHFLGNYYPDIGMWMVNGILPATKMAEGLSIDPAYLTIISGDINADIYDGSFCGDGSIFGNDYNIYGENKTYFIVADDQSQSWGIYDLKLSDAGNEQQNPEYRNSYSNPTGSRMWGGKIAGEGQFGYNDSMGIMEGDVYGTYDGSASGTWIATSVGTWYSKVDIGNTNNIGNYYGLIGGLWDDNAITGKMIAVYAQPGAEIDYDGAPFWGSGLRGNYAIADSDTGNLTVTGVTNGISPGVVGQPWGIWGSDLNGSIADGTKPVSVFKLTLGGENVAGYWLGIMAGIKRPGSDVTIGAFRGIELDKIADYDDGNFYGDSFRGDVTGILGTDGSWQGGGLGEWEARVWQGDDPVINSLNDFIANYVDYDPITGSGSASFNGTGNITFNNLTGETLELKEQGQDGQDWGIYYMSLKGSYVNPQTQMMWSGVMGGKDTHSYWLVHTSGVWQNNEIIASAGGHVLSDGSLGAIEGEVFGLSDENAGTWEAVSVGSWADTPLAFGGELDSGTAFGYYDTFGREVYLENGHMEGLLGGTESLDWTGASSAEVTFIGQFLNSSGDKLWGIDLMGNTSEENTAERAAFVGAIGGIDINNSLEGRLIALYIRPDGNGVYQAGYIISTGDGISGDFYPEIEMFEAYGDLIAYDMETTLHYENGEEVYYTPEDLYSGTDYPWDGSTALRESEFEGVVSGDNISGTVGGDSLGIRGQDWDIWRLGCGGTFTDSSSDWKAIVSGSDKNQDGGIDPWIGIVTGDTWSGNKLSATVSGVTLNYDTEWGFEVGSFEGDLIGVYEGNTWQALGLGTSEQIYDYGIVDGITGVNVVGKGLGDIYGKLMAGLIVGQAFADDGTYKAVLAGTGNINADSEWSLALGAELLDGSGATNGYLLAADRNDPVSGNMLKGVYFRPDTESGVDTFEMGRIIGDISEITNVDTVWTATSTGDWVDLAEIATSALGFDQVALADMVSVPITETYTALLQNANVTGAIDLSVYDNRIFTGIVDLTFANLPGVGQTFDFSSGSDNLGLTFTTVDTVAMTWTADALGQINNMQAEGAGAGLIAANGNSWDFDGVVAGTVTQPVTP